MLVGRYSHGRRTACTQSSFRQVSAEVSKDGSNFLWMFFMNGVNQNWKLCLISISTVAEFPFTMKILKVLLAILSRILWQKCECENLILAVLLQCLWNCHFQCQDGYAKPSGLSGISKHSTFSLALKRVGFQHCHAISGTSLPAFIQLLIHYKNRLKNITANWLQSLWSFFPPQRWWKKSMESGHLSWLTG